MARLLPWLLLAAALLALAVTVWRPDEVAWRLGLGDQLAARQDSMWERRLRSHYRRLDGSTPAGAVVFLGASSVQGLNAAAVRSCTASFGIGGETAEQLVERIGDYRSIDRAAAVVVMTGLNDVLRGRGATLEGTYHRLLAALPADRMVLLSSMQRLPPGHPLADAVGHANIAARRACAGRRGCRYVDLQGAMFGRTAVWEPDGIHLNPAGYALWSQLLRDSLAAAGVAERPCQSYGGRRPR
ncbi:MAG: SGNH/GDSL hydrolase family protein [Sphingomonadaceae bacterium]|nr:SGNH/GDSL hydrolase family protein [Sphingomonadaceae bacterium]